MIVPLILNLYKKLVYGKSKMNYNTKIPKSELIHGFYYKGRCRNSAVARWNAEKQKFFYRRHKFGNTFIEEICCPEDDHIWDVFVAEEVLYPQDITEDMVIRFNK